jgi:hypothetical protein
MMKKTVIYLHGFNSSPQSMKARLSKQYFQQHFAEVDFICPQIANTPKTAIAQLTSLVEQLVMPMRCYFIGSSLGGYFATYLAEKYATKAALINPAVKPYRLLQNYLGRQKNPYTDEVYQVTPDFIDDLKSLEQPTLSEKNNYFVMVQTGDEVLDYQQALTKYKHHKCVVQQGGDHSFIEYDKMLPEIANFFFQ